MCLLWHFAIPTCPFKLLQVTHTDTHSMLRWNQPEIRGLSGFCDWNNLIGLQATRWVVLNHWIGRSAEPNYVLRGAGINTGAQAPLLHNSLFSALQLSTNCNKPLPHTHSGSSSFSLFTVSFSLLCCSFGLFSLSRAATWHKSTKKTLFYRHYYILMLLWCNQAETRTWCEKYMTMSGGHPVS